MRHSGVTEVPQGLKLVPVATVLQRLFQPPEPGAVVYLCELALQTGSRQTLFCCITVACHCFVSSTKPIFDWCFVNGVEGGVEAWGSRCLSASAQEPAPLLVCRLNGQSQEFDDIICFSVVQVSGKGGYNALQLDSEELFDLAWPQETCCLGCLRHCLYLGRARTSPPLLAGLAVPQAVLHPKPPTSAP